MNFFVEMFSTLKAVERYLAHYMADDMYNSVQKETARRKAIELWIICLNEVKLLEPLLSSGRFAFQAEDAQRLLQIDLEIRNHDKLQKEERITEEREIVAENIRKIAVAAVTTNKNLPGVFAFVDKEIMDALMLLSQEFLAKGYEKNPQGFVAAWDAAVAQMLQFHEANSHFAWSILVQETAAKLEAHMFNAKLIIAKEIPLLKTFRVGYQLIRAHENCEPMVKNFIFIDKLNRPAQAVKIAHALINLYSVMNHAKFTHQVELKSVFLRMVQKVDKMIAYSPYLSDLLDNNAQLLPYKTYYYQQFGLDKIGQPSKSTKTK